MATRLNVRVCTWNVGNAPPPADLTAWLGTASDDYDLIVVGVQESNYPHDHAFSPVTSLATSVNDALTPSTVSAPSPSQLQSPPGTPSQTRRSPKRSGVFGLLAKAIRSVCRKRPRTPDNSCVSPAGTLRSSDHSHLARGVSNVSSAGDAAVPSLSEAFSIHRTLSPVSLASPHQAKFTRVVSCNVPEKYHLVVKGQMMEMKLLVYIHDRHRDLVEEKKVFTEATGIGNVIGNKGAVVAKVVLNGTSFCFINSHLAAHEGSKYRESRHRDVAEIMRGVERSGTHGIPMLHAFDHIFWLGDLNYRLNMQLSAGGPNWWPRRMQFGYISKLASQKRYAEIARLDELRNEMSNNVVFSGFSEAPLDFPPTFKVERGNGTALQYQDMRLPAYCDRILHRSRPSHSSHVRWREYSCVQCIDTSDHKPVYGVFDVVIPKRAEWLPQPGHVGAYKCTVNFLRLEVRRFCADDDSFVGRFSDDGTFGTSGESTCSTPDGRWECDTGAGAGPGGPNAPSRTSWGNRTGTMSGVRSGTSSGASSTNSAGSGSWLAGLQTSAISRRARVSFHGDDMFHGGVHRANLQRQGDRFCCKKRELPSLAIKPIATLSELMYKYVTLAFDGIGAEKRYACVLPMTDLVRRVGKHRFSTELTLTRYGPPVGTVYVEVEVNISL